MKIAQHWRLTAQLDGREQTPNSTELARSSNGSVSVKIRLFPQTDYLAFRQIELCGKSTSVQIELSFEFSGRQQVADGVDVR